MEKIKLAIAWLQILIIVGGAARCGYCYIMRGADPDEEHTYRVRMRNVLVFVALSSTIGGLLRIVLDYF